MNEVNPRERWSESSGIPESTNPAISSESIRGRIGKGPIPLHKGFGFGDEKIREHALSIARTAQDSKEARIREFTKQPFTTPPPNHSRTSTLPAPFTKEIHPPAQRTNSEKKIPNRGPLLETKTKVKEPKVHRLLASTAWFLDGVLAVSTFIVSGALNYAWFPVGSSKKIVDICFEALTRIGFEIPQRDLTASIFIAQISVSSLLMLFILQFMMLLVFHGTAGRFAVGIGIKPTQRHLGSVIVGSFSELLTVGGLLALPLILISPTRVPLFAWIRYGMIEDFGSK